MSGKSPMDGTPMSNVRRMEARRQAEGGAGASMDHHVRYRDWLKEITANPPTAYPDVARTRIAAREHGFPEPILGEERTSDGCIRGGDLSVARALDNEIAASKPSGKGRG